MTVSRYAFRDTERAARRLRLLAELWEPASAPFVDEHAPLDVALAYDLGCGPGWTTRLLLPRPAVGLDESAAFIARARRLHPDCGFEVWDVTDPGFPRGRADLLYCRLLLTHLPRPDAALATWAGELRRGGLVLVDEVEAIETEDPVFARYLTIASELIDRRGGRLYAGPELDVLRPDGLRRVCSQAVPLAAPPTSVAELFALNLGVWREAPDVPASQAELDRIAGALRGDHGPITWTMRQIVYRRP